MTINRRLVLIALCGVLVTAPAAAVPQTTIEESLLEDAEDAEDLMEKLEKWKQHPIDLNTANLTELQELPFVSPLMARALIDERNRNGRFRSLTEARTRLGWPESFERLEPFVTVVIRPLSRQRSIRMRERRMTKFPEASGYTDGSYRGTPWKTHRRFAFRYSDALRGGLLIEKDAGEREWYDHIVGYVETGIPSLGLRAVLGHFRLECGQGLVFWGPYGSTRGSDPIAPAKKRPGGARGYAYADENRYLSGIALTLKRGSFLLTAIASRAPLDAAPHTDGSVRGLVESGLHRTDLEHAKKDRVAETLIGGRIQFSGRLGSVGVTGSASRFSRPLSADDPERARFAFRGIHNHVLGFDADVILGRVNLSGEVAVSRSGGWAGLLSAVARVRDFDLAFLIRRFGPDFQNRHSRGFGSDEADNEWGVYIGLRGPITSTAFLSIYYDLSRRPWRTYTLPVPTGGTDLFIQLEQRASRAVWFLRLRLRQDEDHEPGTTARRQADILAVRRRLQTRLECRLKPVPRIDIRSRLETARVRIPGIAGEIWSSTKNESGLLLFHDFRFRPNTDLSLAVRWISFDTPSYDSRIYEFESDLPGVLSLQPLYGKGFRWYTLLKWRYRKWLRLSVKYSVTRRENIESWGTGHDEIEGDTVRGLGFQAEISL